MPDVVVADRRRARSRERGSAAVEAALVTPVVVALVLGIIEFSLILRDYVAISSVARVGARMASANPGSGPGGVCDTTTVTPASTPKFAACAARAIQQAGTAMPKDAIDYIIVYQANSKGYPAPSGTTSTGIVTDTTTVAPPVGSSTPCTAFANCVAYRWVDASDSFTFASGSWASSTVDACPTSAYNVGVWLRATHKNVTGFFGATKTLSDHTVMKFEPLPTMSCNSAAPQPHL